MTLGDPFRNYDTWLATDRVSEAAEADWERMLDEWDHWAEDNDIPVQAATDERHPQHNIFKTWETLTVAVDLYREEKAEEQIAAAIREYEDEIDNDPQSGAANLVEHDPMCGREPDGSCGLSCRCWCHDVESGCA